MKARLVGVRRALFSYVRPEGGKAMRWRRDLTSTQHGIVHTAPAFGEMTISRPENTGFCNWSRTANSCRR